MVEITKAQWQSWPKTEKKRLKNGDHLVWSKNTRTWVKVFWRR